MESEQQLVLTDEQKQKWAELAKHHEAVRKWSDESKTEDDVKAIVMGMEEVRNAVMQDETARNNMTAFVIQSFAECDLEK